MIQIRAGMPSASYQQHLKDQNATLLFDLVRRRAPISRAELTKASGLSAATVTVLVDELLQGGWLVELGAVGSTARGRRHEAGFRQAQARRSSHSCAHSLLRWGLRRSSCSESTSCIRA